MAITIKFGTDNQAVRDHAQYPNVRALAGDASLRSFLGYGDNVDFQRNGLVLTSESSLFNGDVVEVLTRSGKKG